MNFKLFMAIVMSAVFVSCAPAPEERQTSSIVIKLPKSDYSARSVKNIRGIKAVGSSYGLNDITDLNEIDCYAVAVGYFDQNNLVTGSCSGDTSVMDLQIVSQTVPDGGEIILQEVLTGPSRNFYVFGFSTSESTCPDFRSIQFSQLSLMSRPALVGMATQNLAPEEENIVNINISMTGAVALNSCKDGPFSWQKGGVFGTSTFGNAVFGP